MGTLKNPSDLIRKKLKEKSFSFEIFIVGLVYIICRLQFLCHQVLISDILKEYLFIHKNKHPNARLNHFDLRIYRRLNKFSIPKKPGFHRE